jgi:hypothetical protein
MIYGDSITEPTIFYHIFRPADIATTTIIINNNNNKKN